jgi:glutaconyl-CoA/methylmalonyl-CoA decarboxylase subunit gamma
VNYEVEINGGVRHVSIARADGVFHVTVDGRRVAVDAARIDAHSWSLIVSDEVRLKPDTTSDVVSAFRRTFEITIAPDQTPSQVAVGVGPVRLPATVNGRRRLRKEAAAQAAAGPLRVVAPMPGKIVRVLVQSGETVRARQPLVVVEAMKMENELRAGRAGTVAEVRAQAGQSVDAGAVLVVVQ